MQTFRDIRVATDLNKKFSIEDLDLSEIQKACRQLPSEQFIDINKAENYLLWTLRTLETIQEIIVRVDKWIAIKKIEFEKKEATIALTDMKGNGVKTIKDKEWYLATNEELCELRQELELSKVAKTYLEKKFDYFSKWHYSLKTLISREQLMEREAGIQTGLISDEKQGELDDFVSENE